MNIQVPAQRVDQAIDERLKSLSRTVRINGFRPGKVPVNVVQASSMVLQCARK